MRKILYILLTLPLFTFGQVQDSCYSVTDFMSQTETVNPAITKNFTAGWNMFGYPCTQSLDLVEALSSIIDKVIIVKNNNGSVYMPEFGFNGIGYLESGEGYQIKLSDTEYSFSFCESINWPDLEGCTDCEATNFDQWATKDDGSCNYDSDGDGINDANEIIGCQDSLGCNYDVLATDEADCTYPEEGYNCAGDFAPKIGDFVEGGIVFYIDESDVRKGLVISTETIGSVANWGCNEVSLPDARGQIIGTGLTNTLFGCSDENSAAALCLSHEVNGYDDWYLPSVNELDSAFTNIIFPNFLNEIDLEINYSGTDWIWSSTAYIEETHARAIKISGSASWWIGESGRYRYNGHLVVPIRAFGYTLGCMDLLACNYNPDANMADGSCEYPKLGYDCVDNFKEYVVGMEAEGGIVFYVDETGERGLVLGPEDLTEAATYLEFESTVGYVELIGYEFGCNGIEIEGADGTEIGTGYQNTMDIVNQGCTISNNNNYESFITAAQAALDYVSDDYNDWYVPSRDELVEAYNVLENNEYTGNINGFGNWYYHTSSEQDFSSHHIVDMYDFSGNEHHGGKNSLFRLRPIRTFGYTLGCTDSLAYNYNPKADRNDGSCECEYPIQSYDCEGNITAEIGDVMEGGYLFYIDETGKHGLVAAMEDLEGTYEWGCHGTEISGAYSRPVGTGYQNTLDIVADCSDSTIAASKALAYESEGYNDWYLPSLGELQEMYNTIGSSGFEGGIGGFSINYWSSSKSNAYQTEIYAYYYNFYHGVSNYGKRNNPIKVRVIRAF